MITIFHVLKHTFSFKVQSDFKRNVVAEIAVICYVVSKGKPNDIITHSCLASFDNDRTDKLVNLIKKAFHAIHSTYYIFPWYESLQLCASMFEVSLK